MRCELLSTFTRTLVAAAAFVLLPLPAFCQQVDDQIAVDAADWPWWRGPQRNGVANPNQDPPTEWSASQNVAWKSPVPGRGHSSPTVVGRARLSRHRRRAAGDAIGALLRPRVGQTVVANGRASRRIDAKERKIHGSLEYRRLRRRERVYLFCQQRGRLRHGPQPRWQAALANEDQRLHDSPGLWRFAGHVSVAGDRCGR